MRPIQKASIVGIITMVLYLFVVVITTPALEPLAAISAAFQLNVIVIIGMGIGIGLQVFLSEKSKLLGCKLSIKKKAFGRNSGGVATISFFSFFSLVPLGCCGWWLCIIITTRNSWNRSNSCTNTVYSSFSLSRIGSYLWIYRTNCFEIKT